MNPTSKNTVNSNDQKNLPSPASGRGAGGEGKREGKNENKAANPNYTPAPPAKLPPDLLRHARAMRNQATDAEKLMWRMLRNRRLRDAKFRRQRPIGRYIADFYCAEHRLVIELDGGQHAGQQTYDAERTAFLEQRGLRVLRFWNNQVLNETEAVLECIWRELGSELDGGGGNEDTLTPTPLPPAGEGLEKSSVDKGFEE